MTSNPATVNVWSTLDNRCQHDRDRGIGEANPRVVVSVVSGNLSNPRTMTRLQAHSFARHLRNLADAVDDAAQDLRFNIGGHNRDVEV